MSKEEKAAATGSLNFIEIMVEEDIASGKHQGRVHTRFPPEPNGYLHIGHAKSICLNFGLADKYNGKTNLRFDDTNPVTEDTEYVESIKEDIKWLGFNWEHEFYASDYFQQLYEFAIVLIKKGLAYVDDQTAEQIASQKGTPTMPGTHSPFRERSVAENIDLFERMRGGEFEEGSKVLRAKIDMAHANMHFRDPLMYRIKKAHHHRTGDDWCIYPMYDFAHGQCDSIEKITHSICTLEFEVHRPLYEWYIKELGIFPSQQIEFARLNLNYTIMSKRKLLRLVNEKHVSGWDDPRMPTISGLRRRGYTPEAIREFCHRIGIARREHVIDVSLLEFCLREHLNKNSERTMAVLHPLKLVISNFEEGEKEILQADNNTEAENPTQREITFSRELFIEHDDFMEVPVKNYNRLYTGGMVRLKHGFIIRCDECIKNANGEITQLNCTYFPESRSGKDTSGLKTKGVIHWVDANNCIDAEVRLYDRLFNAVDPEVGDGDFIKNINPHSLHVMHHAKLEPAMKDAKVENRFQFLRMGYFCLDKDAKKDRLIFNRTVTLKDTWSKEASKN